jgi:CheY-like chemotaxis protein
MQLLPRAPSVLVLLSPPPPHRRRTATTCSRVSNHVTQAVRVYVCVCVGAFVSCADEKPNQRIIVRLLNKLGVVTSNITVLDDGQAAVDFLNSSPRLDLVFMDIRMPGKGGLDVLREAPPQCPVVVMTGNVEANMMAAYTGAGVAAVLAKPFDFAAVRVAVDTAMDSAAPPSSTVVGSLV